MHKNPQDATIYSKITYTLMEIPSKSVSSNNSQSNYLVGFKLFYRLIYIFKYLYKNNQL